MHQQLANLLEMPVHGELTVSGESLRDAARGRVCLERLSREGVFELVTHLERHWQGAIVVRDFLFLEDSTQPIRGVVEVEFENVEGDTGYVLEIGQTAVFELYERRFLLDVEQWADLRGVLVDGLGRLVASGAEVPLRVISGFDELMEAYLQQLQRVIAAARAGEEADTEPWLHDFSRRLRDAWELIPWPLRVLLKEPLYGRTPDDALSCDTAFETTVIFAANMMEGTVPSGSTYESPDAEPDANYLSTLAATYGSLASTFLAPYYAVAIGRSPSVASFVAAFPRYKKAVGSIRLADELKLG